MVKNNGIINFRVKFITILLFVIPFMLMNFRILDITEVRTLSVYENYLTGGSSRQWNIVDNYPKDSSYECNYPSARTEDNIYTFNINNTFSFNPGLMFRNDSSDLCFDPENHIGSWYIIENDTKFNFNVISSANQSIYYSDTLTLESINDSIFIVSKQGINHVFKRK